MYVIFSFSIFHKIPFYYFVFFFVFMKSRVLGCARDHLRPVGGPQRDARAGLGPQGAEPRRKEQPPGRKAPEKSLFHKLNYLIRFHYSLRGPVGPPHCSCLLQESGPDCRPKARQWHFPHRGCGRQPCPGEDSNGLPANKRGPRCAEPPFNREKRPGSAYSAEAGKYFMYCTRCAMAAVSSPNLSRPRNSSSEEKP